MNIKDKYLEIREALGTSFDITVEYLALKKDTGILAYVDGFIDRDLLNRDIIGAIRRADFDGNISGATSAISKTVQTIDEFVTEILSGFLGLYLGEYYLFDLRKWEKRDIQSPDAENVTRGPKEGFTEDLVTNSVLLRRKLRNTSFIMDSMKIGKQSNTTVVIGYIKGIADTNIVEKVKSELRKINVDGVMESGKLEQYLDKRPYSTVSGIGVSQKPDIVAKRLLEGRIAIVCDGTPHVLTIPELFIENFKTAEDYYHRVLFGTFMRFMRFIGLSVSVLLPGLAVAVTTYNPEMLPVSYLTTIIRSVANTPFPESIEILFLILMLELLKESGTRLPKTIGSAVSIVGALIIGDAAVRAGIVGAPTVMIVALTAVSSFIIPNLNEFTTVYRLVFLLLGALFGVIGIAAGIAIVLIQLASIDSFGVPILSYVSKSELKDSLIRFPLPELEYRPRNIAKGNIRRSRWLD
ncbi:MAG: spore germination protein [Christensenellaceae bacterium]|jgi:spore germination protein KA|nr:spore germination protein [Christensenellaceae bacterium]